MKPFSFVWYIIPLLKTGALASTRYLLCQVDNEKTHKNRRMRFRWLLLATIFAQWQHLDASNKALNLLHQAMHAVLYRRTAAAIKMACKVGQFFCRCFVCCSPGGRWGNTEQVATQWRHPVASRVALDMLHWAMPSILLRRTAMAIEMASGWGTFAHRCLLFPEHYL